MPELDIVDWFEGMVIKPQHFQQSTLSIIKQFGHILQYATPHSYGIIDIELQSSLGGGFVLKKAECIMPDFSILNFNADKESAISLMVEEEEFYIYLCVNPSNKFISRSSEPVADLHNPNAEVAINRLSIQPFLSKDPTRIAIPIAHYVGGKKSQYDPPRLFFADCHYSHSELMSLVDRMTDMLNQASLKHKKREAMNLYGAAIAKCLMTISSALNESTNPYNMHLALSTAVTHLIGILDEDIPPLNIKYHHSQIYQSFLPLFNFIQRKLDQIDRQYSDGVGKFRLTQVTSDYVLGKSAFIYPITQPNPKLLLYVKQGTSYKDKVEKLTICAYSEIESNLLNRLTGCSRRIIKMVELENEMMIELQLDYPTINTELAIMADSFINNVYLS